MSSAAGVARRGSGNVDGDAIAGLDGEVGACFAGRSTVHVALLDQPLDLRS